MVKQQSAMSKKNSERFLKIKTESFLFEELVKRDFKAKYKRTVLGMLWSLLSPLLTLLIMRIVFTSFFGETVEHYTTYLFCGNIVWAFFSESVNGGMSALVSNSEIFSKINVPKYLFLLSKNVSSLINFGLTFVVFLLFCMIDGVALSTNMLFLIFPIVCLILFNIGIGMILSALFVFFRDVEYLWGIFSMLLMYLSAIFYTVDAYSPIMQKLFLLNPLYVYIRYFRAVVIGFGDGAYIPSFAYHCLCIFYALTALLIGIIIYKKKNHKFLYYI